MAEFVVALDARELAGERKGIGRYVHTLLTGLARLDAPPAVTLVADRPVPASYPPLRVDTVVVPGRPVYYWEQCALPHALKRLNADVFHFPANALPYRPPRPAVLTLHDAMMFDRSYHTAAANRYYAYQSYILKKAAARCAAVITVSRVSAQRIAARLGPRVGAALTVIAEAADEIFFRRRSAEDVATFRTRRNLPDTYILHLGAAFPRKNTRLVIETYKALDAAAVPPLVIGGVARGDEAVIKGWLTAVGLDRTVKVQTYLPPEEQAMLFQAATALVFPSADEGFGLPALEAMAAGVPVITSRRGALPETCGDAARYADLTVDALGAAMASVTTDASERRRLIAAGTARVGEFSPRRMAEKTVGVYRKVLA